ncbi:extracellular solute-binding protein [Paenibacillus jilunlii]|uniref:Multiple sugar transport system substrate-binding protein n=1 Tax=Paenibacillus jilunlii TaxID=682956 RepID=A0A1G9TKI7_9BACL|nr:extracellular solute-binding protein [Paenibacillus jilunlii]SDM48190.1 multiple sugar transport system substrate-binding protein [Paenibacillus jilunlii]
MKHNLLQKVMFVSLSVMFIGISAGLSTGRQVSANSDNQADTKQTLKVLYKEKYYFDEKSFKLQFPNTEIQEVKWDGKSDIKGFIAEQSPDVIMLNTLEYKQLSKENQLTELGQLIKRDNYDTTTIYPGMLDALKMNGKLYGLSPTFNTESIFYNVDLFKKYNVPLPKDGMTWEELLKLSAKFPTSGNKDTRIWGLHYPLDNYTYLINDIATSEGLTRYNPNTLKVTINTAAWKKVYSMAITAIKSNSIEGSNTSGYTNDPFIMGRAAMTVSTSSMDTLRDVTADKAAIANYKPFTVKIAAGPADPKDRKITRNIHLPSIMAIPASSANKDIAWDFIKFYNGADFAKSRSDQPLGYSLTRMDYSKEYKGLSLEAFYKLKPNLESPPYLNPMGIPFNNSQYSIILQSEVKQVISNKKTLDKALASIETQVQKSLDDAVKKEKAKK